jgi:hypothetical protein
LREVEPLVEVPREQLQHEVQFELQLDSNLSLHLDVSPDAMYEGHSINSCNLKNGSVK